MEKISVILTTYNSEATLQRTIDSILNQSGINKLFELELIVVDDCSTDNTRVILNKNGINYCTTESNSGGPNKGRNIGLKKISGKYFCLIDHDDVWHPEKLMKQLSIAGEFPVVSTGYIITDNQMTRTVKRMLDSETPVTFRPNQTFIQKLQRKNKGQNMYLSSLMLNSKLKNFLFEENFGMIDYDWLLNISENNPTAEIPEILLTRYVNLNNLSLNAEYRKKDYYFSLYILENYLKKYPNESATGIKRLNGTRARYFYIQNNMKEARKFFLKSEFNIKQIAYLISTYSGSKFVKKKIFVFG